MEILHYLAHQTLKLCFNIPQAPSIEPKRNCIFTSLRSFAPTGGHRVDCTVKINLEALDAYPDIAGLFYSIS